MFLEQKILKEKIKDKLDRVAGTMYGSNCDDDCDDDCDGEGHVAEKDGDRYSFNCGDVCCQVIGCRKITKQEYKILSKYL